MGTGKSRTGAARKTMLWIAAVAAVMCVMCACGAKEEREEREIVGIWAADVEATADGRGYGIEVKNVLPGDEVEYSEDGKEYTTTRPEYREPGEYTVYYRVKRKGYKAYSGSARVKITAEIPSGISAEASVYVYDGEAHGIEIEGTRPGDRIKYSEDGERYTAERIEKTEVGRYRIYYRVERNGGEYADESEIIILPDIRGRYLNEDDGVIELGTDRAKHNGQEYAMTYDETGEGEINGTAFQVNDGKLTTDGKEYEGIDETEKVYRITSEGKGKYVRGGAEITVEIKFGAGKARIEYEGKTVAEKEGNYCENGETDYETGDARVTKGSTGEITDVTIEITTRKTRGPQEQEITVMYEGPYTVRTDEAALYKTGEEWTAEAPTVNEPGEYEVRAVILDDEYTPTKMKIKVYILPDMTGVYYNGTGYIEMTRENITLEHGKIKTADNEEVTVTERGISVGGEEYVKHSQGKLIAIEIAGETTVVEATCKEVRIRIEGGRARVYIDGAERASGEAGSGAVKVNGEGIGGIPTDAGAEYELGKSELNRDIIRITVE